MAAPKARKPAGNPARKPAPANRPPAKELKLWQLGAFILLGLAIAGLSFGYAFAKKTHDEYGQWPWARSAVPPLMYYDARHYQHGTAGTLPAGAVSVGKTPGGGAIFATTTVKKPVPTTIWVQNTKTHAVSQYALSGGP